MASAAPVNEWERARAELRELYLPRMDAVSEAMSRQIGLSYPLLIDPLVEYFESPRRLMIVGQQALNWGLGPDEAAKLGGLTRARLMDELMALYADFRMAARYRDSAFWHAARALQASLNPNASPYGLAWGNLVRMDHKGDRPSADVDFFMQSRFGVVPDEIRILHPDVVLFFTGPFYDYRLYELFPRAQFDSVVLANGRASDKDRFARVTLEPGSVVTAFRTYHPNYLRRQGLFDQYLSDLAWVLGGKPIPPSN